MYITPFVILAITIMARTSAATMTYTFPAVIVHLMT